MLNARNFTSAEVIHHSNRSLLLAFALQLAYSVFVVDGYQLEG